MLTLKQTPLTFLSLQQWSSISCSLRPTLKAEIFPYLRWMKHWRSFLSQVIYVVGRGLKSSTNIICFTYVHDTYIMAKNGNNIRKLWIGWKANIMRICTRFLTQKFYIFSGNSHQNCLKLLKSHFPYKEMQKPTYKKIYVKKFRADLKMWMNTVRIPEHSHRYTEVSIV